MLLDRIYNFFSSLKLTVVCLALALVLVFIGTLAQVELGLYKAQNEFFRSVFVYWTPKGANWKIPVFPGGYLIGTVLLVNLVAAHFRRFEPTRKKIGVAFIHGGLVLLLLGQLLTDMLASESTLHLREGQTKDYSESDRATELAVIDVTEAGADKVVAIPEALLARREEIRHGALPFTIRVNKFFLNSALAERTAKTTEPPPATEGFGPQLLVSELPRVTTTDRRDMPSAIVELVGGNGSLGTWLLSSYLSRPQTLAYNGRTYELWLRFQRHYKPFSITLLDFRHDRYAGTEIPKNFSSRVRLQRPETGEDREVLIYMNNPLRYWGETYYQASFDRDDGGSILQVVRNPSWLAPYLACVLVTLGLVVQFLMHLVDFAVKRKRA